MANAEIQYLVGDASKHQEDVEQIIAAIGAFQNEAHFTVLQTTEIAERAQDSIFIKLVRSLPDAKQYAVALEAADSMKKGVEAHFSDEDRDRLRLRFAGILLSGELETE